MNGLTYDCARLNPLNRGVNLCLHETGSYEKPSPHSYLSAVNNDEMYL